MRTEKVRRFVDVQRQLQRAAERTLNDLRQEEYRLHQAQQDVFEALNGEDELSIGLAPALTRRLARLVTDAQAAAAAGDRQVDIVLQQASRLKHAERLERTLASEEDRAREKIALGDLLDVILGGPGATVR
jgi:uncharacterized membrane protein YheB (UPF0754 family)